MMPTSEAPRYLATRLMCAVIALGSGTGTRSGLMAPAGACARTRSKVFRRSAESAEVSMRLRGSGETRLFR